MYHPCKHFFAFFLLSFLASLAHAQLAHIPFKGPAFTHGEHLKYRVHYGFVSAGYATLDIYKDPVTRGGKETFRCVGIGESVGAFDWFFKVRDRYETYIDKKTVLPALFIRRVDEGGYIINQDYVFNQEQNKVFNGKKFFPVPAGIHDMLSAFYYARSLDFSKAMPGDIISIPMFVDDSLYQSKLKFIRREVLKTEAGSFKCMVFRPVIQTGRIFKHEEDLNVWITDDENKIPIRAQANILVGSIKMDLVEYSGLVGTVSKTK